MLFFGIFERVKLTWVLEKKWCCLKMQLSLNAFFLLFQFDCWHLLMFIQCQCVFVSHVSCSILNIFLQQKVEMNCILDCFGWSNLSESMPHQSARQLTIESSWPWGPPPPLYPTSWAEWCFLFGMDFGGLTTEPQGSVFLGCLQANLKPNEKLKPKTLPTKADLHHPSKRTKKTSPLKSEWTP